MQSKNAAAQAAQLASDTLLINAYVHFFKVNDTVFSFEHLSFYLQLIHFGLFLLITSLQEWNESIVQNQYCKYSEPYFWWPGVNNRVSIFKYNIEYY